MSTKITQDTLKKLHDLRQVIFPSSHPSLAQPLVAFSFLERASSSGEGKGKAKEGEVQWVVAVGAKRRKGGKEQWWQSKLGVEDVDGLVHAEGSAVTGVKLVERMREAWLAGELNVKGYDERDGSVNGLQLSYKITSSLSVPVELFPCDEAPLSLLSVLAAIIPKALVSQQAAEEASHAKRKIAELETDNSKLAAQNERKKVLLEKATAAITDGSKRKELVEAPSGPVIPGVSHRLACHVAKGFKELSPGLEVEVQLDLVDTAPDNGETGVKGYQRSQRFTRGMERFLPDYDLVMEKFAREAGVEWGKTNQEDLGRHPAMPAILRKVVDDATWFGEQLAPETKRLGLRAACPHEGCGWADKAGLNNVYDAERGKIHFSCPHHGPHEVDLHDPADVAKVEFNTPLRNLVRSVAYASEAKDGVVHVKVTGSDYAGAYQEQLMLRPWARLAGFDGDVERVERPPVIIYAPLVVDWAGSKLSKSLYVKQGAYKYLEDQGLDYVLSVKRMIELAANTEKLETDVLLCIKPEFMDLIASRKKNHEFRKYRLKETVERLWFYQTAPVSAITHVCTCSRAKVPGEVIESSGVGNDDFDAGKKVSKFGYEVKELWKLEESLGVGEMRNKYGLKPPQGRMYLPRTVFEGEQIQEMVKLF
ncbi:hypothetical protein MNV49_006146 [Pseudohyphozyma bogoriensis]|nr:hypothetical protein MNV49_006146 [Pseudohyphozyma bogoriensis]